MSSQDFNEFIYSDPERFRTLARQFQKAQVGVEGEKELSAQDQANKKKKKKKKKNHR